LGCQRVQELIHGYVDGELNSLQAAEFERHINQCEDCKLGFRSEKALCSSLRDTSLYYRAPENLKKRIRYSLQKEERHAKQLDVTALT
jgi:anti-sigma factor RsiW